MTLTFLLKREHKITDHLEKELKRITEQILSVHRLEKNSSLFEEHQNLKNEYNILARKNDTLVSKNIELANRVERVFYTHTLENILDTIRERINILLQREYTDDSNILLRAVEKEISQLKRARSYLGKALYNLGVLYLRMGDTQNGLKELRAARALGIDDAKLSQLIKSLG